MNLNCLQTLITDNNGNQLKLSPQQSFAIFPWCSSQATECIVALNKAYIVDQLQTKDATKNLCNGVPTWQYLGPSQWTPVARPLGSGVDLSIQSCS